MLAVISIVLIGWTGSMRPTFVGGELRTVIHKPYSEIHKGDIVLRKDCFGRVIPHRAVEKWLGRWTTKGDNNRYSDAAKLDETNYLGVIFP